ncbi:MFS transporter [Streptomyces sp. NPDC048290]|uniref:MFS transporter n=1 Tax=Streptomyces sp. NPDC048290 TaxID=3155811 RepID=UPI00344498C9
MRSYRELFRTPEFGPLFLATGAGTAAQTVAGLALATQVHRATGSPLLAAVSMFGPSLAQVVGATFFLSAADRVPPRAALTVLSLTFAAGTALLAVPGLPLGSLFAVILLMGLVASVGGGIRWGLLNEILPKDGYLLGRSVFNMMNGLTQITGFATAGVLTTVLSPRLTLTLAAALHLASALVTARGLAARRPRGSGRPSIAATWRTNAVLWSSRPRRLTYLGLWLPNGLVVGCESLFVPYDPGSAGVLLACAALGMFVGDVGVGRFLSPARRAGLAHPLLLLLAAPYLLFPLHPSLPLAAFLAALASTGFAASLIQQERLMSLTPPALSGHALGLHSAGMLTMQGTAATLAGTIAQFTSPAAAMGTMAALSLTVTGGLAMAGRRGGVRRVRRVRPSAPAATALNGDSPEQRPS